MGATLRRFFLVVAIAATLVVATGVALIARASIAQWRAGIPFTMAVDWYVMTIIGFVMVGVFVHIRLVLWRRMKRAVDAGDWPSGARALASIRRAVLVNLVLGVVVIVVTRFSGAA
nr:CopD family protein [Schlegelella koreensis]